MRRGSLMLITLLIGGGAVASEPCASVVLWVEYVRLGGGKPNYERSVVPAAAYLRSGW
jgi:hypothetical protein